MACVLKGLLS